jgi:hypothetical protein
MELLYVVKADFWRVLLLLLLLRFSFNEFTSITAAT